MIYLNQNLFSLDRYNVRENCDLFIVSEERGKALTFIYQDFFNDAELDYKNFTKLYNEARRELYNYFVIDVSENRKISSKLKIIWDRRVL